MESKSHRIRKKTAKPEVVELLSARKDTEPSICHNEI